MVADGTGVMATVTLEETVDALVALSTSDRPLSPAPVDDIVDPYLIGFSKETAVRRSELARQFLDMALASPRAEFIYMRILRRIP